MNIAFEVSILPLRSCAGYACELRAAFFIILKEVVGLKLDDRAVVE